jgi:putative protein-disulfide isomerase
MVTIAYHTDPACPWSWGLEPVVRKLMVEFDAGLRWTFVMGGLVRSLAGEAAVRAALVEDWLRASAETEAPLDPLIWLEDALDSTYPACMAFEAGADQAADGGYRYLRRLREGIMCDRRKLDHAEALVEEARTAGLDVERFRVDLRSHAITEAFAADLERTEALGKRASGRVERASLGWGGAPLPTLVFRGADGAEREAAGHRPYEEYRAIALELGATPARPDPLGVEQAARRFGRVTTREVELLCDLHGPRAGAGLFRLAEQWRLRPVRCLTGYLWEAA